MPAYGIALAADALSKALASGPQTAFELEAGLPEYEKTVLGNVEARRKLNEARAEEPLKALTRESSLEALEAKRPFIQQLTEADVAEKLLAPTYKQAQINKFLTEAQASGLKVEADPKGNFTIIDQRAGSPTFGKSIASGTAQETPADLLGQAKTMAEIEGLGATKEKTLAETAQVGELSPLQKYLKEIDWYSRLLGSKELAARRIHQSQVDRLGVEQRSRYLQLEDDSRAEVRRALSTKYGNDELPGENINEQNAIMDYLVQRQLQQKVSTWNKVFGDELHLPELKLLPHPEWDKYLAPKPIDTGGWEWLTNLFSPAAPNPTSTTPPTAPKARVAPDLATKYRNRYGISVEADAMKHGITPESILSNPEIQQALQMVDESIIGVD